MTPSEYASEIIAPTVREFADSRDDRRRAIIACIVTYSLAEYLRKAGAKQAWARTRKICADEADIVQGVCNGSKHCGPDRKTRYPFAPSDATKRPAAVWGDAEWDRSLWGDEHGAVEVEPNGKTFDLYLCVKAVLETFRSQHPAHFESVDFTGC